MYPKSSHHSARSQPRKTPQTRPGYRPFSAALVPMALLATMGCSQPDSEPMDTGNPPPPTPTDTWEWCPSADAWEGDDSWPHRLEVTEDAVFCSLPFEGRTLKQELEMKAQMRWIEGSYPLPTEATDAPMTLPICFNTPNSSAIEMDGAGRVTANHYVYGDSLYVSHQLEQPFVSADGQSQPLVTYLNASGPVTQDAEPFVVDGTASYEAVGSSDVHYQDYDFELASQRQFGSCTGQQYANQHQFVIPFTGGSATLDLRIGASFADTEPSAFVRAEGTLDGQDFVQTDYFKLLYNPTHHHSSQAFAVLFDEPIGEACGLKVHNHTNYTAHPWQVATIDCEVNELESREVLIDYDDTVD